MSNILQTLLDTYQQNPAAALALIPELGQAVEDGKIIEPPCKVGDTVYCTNTGKIKEAEVTSFGGYGATVWFTLDVSKNVQWTIRRFGKTVFLTREAAEQALKERGKNG
ncbi:MAG: hypothetical protein E7L17_14465 [Clostridium sp.]|uniref:hypothetical protein n=1 Tax=Clostridium sp. TaxID=1506 RepID=UPI0029123310|nr:hypothetical protein [Clostridium sp.]MDU7339303.1 hypothetical protein [Clostridium sp.]